MPVRITRTGGAGDVRLLASGAVPTVAPANAESDVTVPWLMLTDSVRDARVEISQGGALPMHQALTPLDSDERLVAFAGVDAAAAQSLFPQFKIVPVQLDPSRALLRPAEAWESLDGIVLSPAYAARLNDSQIDSLLSAGTLIAVFAEKPRDSRWPWKKSGDWWVLRHDVIGPTTIINSDAYLPTYGWLRGWPLDFRREILAIAAVFSILILALLLWRSRWASVAGAILCLISAGGFAAWYSRQSPVLQLASGIEVRGADLSQLDSWTWQSPVRATDSSFRSAHLARPVFGSLRQPEQMRLQLICGSDGRADRYTFHLEPGQSQAFVTREVFLNPKLPELSPPGPALDEFIKSAYLGPGDRVLGTFEIKASGAAAREIVVISSH